MKNLNLAHNLPLFISLVVVSVVLPLVVFMVLTQSTENRSKAAPNSQLYFYLTNTNLQPNQTATMNIMVNPGTNKVTSADIHIIYDPTKVNITNIIPSSLFRGLRDFYVNSLSPTSADANFAVGVPTPNPNAVPPQTYHDVSVKTLSSVATVYFTPLQTGSSAVSFSAETIAAGYTVGLDANSLPDEKGNIISSTTPITLTVSTPTPSATPTNTPIPSATPTVAPTNTPTVTPTRTPTPTTQPTVTPTRTPTPTTTQTNSPTPTVTPTRTPTPTQTPTITPTRTPTPTSAPTSTPTSTPLPTNSPSPTLTLTPTPTSVPTASILVKFKINYVTTHFADRLVALTVTNSQNTVLLNNSFTAVSDSQGIYSFTVNNLPVSNVTIKLKPKQTLTKKFLNISLANGAQILDLTTSQTYSFNGVDIDKDNNVVDIFDYNVLVSNFGSSGASGFHIADLDYNGTVDIFDYNILVNNFGQTGEN